MHYLQLFITKKEDHEDPENSISEFLSGYEDHVWDWYQFGGRWKDLFEGETTIPLKDALPKLNEMLENKENETQELKDTCLKILQGESDLETWLQGYRLESLGELLSNKYCQRSLFYTLDNSEAWTIPKNNYNDYQVTIVDIHN